MLAALLLLLLCPFVSGTPQTRYIDDDTGDPITGLKPQYSPANQWSEGNKCTGCNIRPNISSAYNGTWHDTTHFKGDTPRSLQLTFTGISLTVYCIIPSSSAQAIINYDLDFYLDGSSVGNRFSFTPNSTDYQYNFPVFSVDKLSNAEHNFTMTASSSSTDSVVLFDYATYVYDDSLPTVSPSTAVGTGTSNPAPTRSAQSSSRSPSNVSVIAGGVVSGVALIAIIAIAFLCVRRRRRHRTPPSMQPFVPPHDYSRPTTEAYVERVRIPLNTTTTQGRSEASAMSHSRTATSVTSTFLSPSLPTGSDRSSEYPEDKAPPSYDSIELESRPFQRT